MKIVIRSIVKIIMMSNENLNRFYTLIVACTLCLVSYPQGFKVKDLKANMNDGSAFNAPKDKDGRICGLIKVRTEDRELKFSGEVIGDVENKTNEYWVYVPAGTQQITIEHPNFLPMNINLSDYGIDKIDTKTTYVLVLSELEYKKEKCGLTTTIKPENAHLYINDTPINCWSGNGFYQLFLPKDDYVCRIELEGYRPQIHNIQTGKEIQNLNIELESIMAELEVKSKTSTADIYIDNVKKGNGNWKGSILPGNHKIEVRQKNYNTEIKDVNLLEKESRVVSFPELKRAMGKLRIETIPKMIPVSVDGREIGVSPCEMDIESGSHYITCNTFGCEPYREDIEIEGNKTNFKKITLEYLIDNNEYEDSRIDYKKAYEDNEDAIIKTLGILITNYHSGWGGKGKNKEILFWLKRLKSPFYILDLALNKMSIENFVRDPADIVRAVAEAGDPDYAVEIYRRLKKEINNDHDHGWVESIIGNAYMQKGIIEKAIAFFEMSDEKGYEGLGDCYLAKGNKQLAATYYRKCLDLDFYYYKERVERKLKELGL